MFRHRAAWMLCVCLLAATAPRRGVHAQQGPQDLPRERRFDPAAMRSRLVVPVTDVKRFASAVTDAHSHAYAKDAAAIAEWVRLKDDVGVRTSFVLTGATGDTFRELSARYAQAHPGRFVMFAGFEKTGIEDAGYADRLRRQVRADAAAGARGFGELTDKGLGFVREGERRYFIDDRRFDPLWDEAGKLGLPVFVHIAEPAAFSAWRSTACMRGLRVMMSLKVSVPEWLRLILWISLSSALVASALRRLTSSRSAPTGLTTKSVAPARIADTTLSMPPCAVCTITGVVSPASRMRPSTPRPSRSGITRSSTTASIVAASGPVSSAAAASPPSATSTS